MKDFHKSYGTTALKLAYVAKGGLIATIASDPKLWDIAAGTVIAEAARAIVTDWQEGKIFPIDLENYGAQQYKLLAANKKIHSQIVELLNS